VWINVPRARKDDDPRYGTQAPETLPVLTAAGVSARVLAGEVEGLRGPFETVQSVQMVDFTLEAGASYRHAIPASYETCLVRTDVAVAVSLFSVLSLYVYLRVLSLCVRPVNSRVVVAHLCSSQCCAGVLLQRARRSRRLAHNTAPRRGIGCDRPQ
jgi:hypothetical protein